MSDTQKFLIFDFDGTIADSLLIMVRSYNDVAQRYGLKKLDENDLGTLKNQDITSIIHYLNISFIKLPFVVYSLRSRYYHYRDEVAPVAGIQDVLQSARKQGSMLGLLTSNNYKNVSQFLHKHALDFFDVVKTGSGIFSKSRKLHTMSTQWSGPRSNIFYVGDEVRDMKAAHDAGLKSIAVTWGFDSRSLLEACNPSLIIDKPQELLF